jgi:hypothetical protein
MTPGDRRRAAGRGRATGRWLISAALAAAACLLTPSAASAAPGCSSGRPNVSMVISTVPVVPGARITVNGRPVTTDGAGRAQLLTCRLANAGDVKGPDAPVALPGKRRATFDRFFLSGQGSRLQIAFGVEHEVSFTFSGLPTKEITTYTLRSSTGQVITYDDLEPVWLLGSRVLRGPDGLEERDIYYSVDSVLVAGSSVVNRSQTKFYPDQRSVVRVPLLAFDVQVIAVDRLFRFPVGSAVTLRGLSGLTYKAPLADGRASFKEIPRGSYEVVADAPGLRVARSLTLSRDQLVVLPVITWLDLMVLIGGPSMLAVALILAPRPRLRRRIANAVAPAFRWLPLPARPRHARRAAHPHDATTVALDLRTLSGDQAGKHRPVRKGQRAGALDGSSGGGWHDLLHLGRRPDRT